MINLATEDWKINNIDTILFDKDGTFIDLHSFWGKITELRILEILKIYDIDNSYFNELCLFLGYDTKAKKMLSNGITAIYSRNIIIEKLNQKLKEITNLSNPNEIELIFDNITKEFNTDMFNFINPIDSAIDFIKKMYSKGIKLGIVTSDSVETTILTLEYFNLKHVFKTIIGRESSNFTKESGEPTKLALKNLNSTSETALMIGDTKSDYISAKKAGIQKVILTATGQEPLEELKKITPCVIYSLKEIQCS